jgi:hypothetical protein
MKSQSLNLFNNYDISSASFIGQKRGEEDSIFGEIKDGIYTTSPFFCPTNPAQLRIRTMNRGRFMGYAGGRIT